MSNIFLLMNHLQSLAHLLCKAAQMMNGLSPVMRLREKSDLVDNIQMNVVFGIEPAK